MPSQVHKRLTALGNEQNQIVSIMATGFDNLNRRVTNLENSDSTTIAVAGTIAGTVTLVLIIGVSPPAVATAGCAALTIGGAGAVSYLVYKGAKAVQGLFGHR